MCRVLPNVFLATLLAYTASGIAGGETKNVYFGDTHLHTSYSFDAYFNQNFDASPDTAYRWAKGLPVIHPFNRSRVQIDTPLDFLVVADHAEFLGLLPAIANDTAEFDALGWWAGIKRWVALWAVKRALTDADARARMSAKLSSTPSENLGGDPVADPGNKPLGNSVFGNTDNIQRGAWEDIITTADRHNEPGRFTAFIGWEWSSTPSGANQHRVVFTPDDASVARLFLPYGSDKSQYPEDLWDWLIKTGARTGARFLAIPHNPNVSKGFMFGSNTLKGEVISADYARIRAQLEPVAEITQTKGDSETHPALSPEDEFADFEAYPFYLQYASQHYIARPGEYIRSALKEGLKIAARTGVNPYAFGVIGSTDSHTGLSSAEEYNFHGKIALDSIPENKAGPLFGSDVYGENSATGWTMSASGIAAVWAQENTRDSLYAAFMRREVYGTTGPRIQVRVFGGWDFPAQGHLVANLGTIGYARGVPMGGQLQAEGMASLDQAAPQFIVQALKDPNSGNLDRVQMIKGWVDEVGDTHEKIYELAWSGDRQLDSRGKLEAVGNTVNITTGKFENSIGTSALSAHWTDPDFNPRHAAFYYVRVLEIPTPRHSLLDAIALQQASPPQYAETIQERAYTSAIWYQPKH